MTAIFVLWTQFIRWFPHSFPELFYYNQTCCFLALRDAEYNDWLRIHGELSHRLIST